ncbi:MAG: hypothetical protein MUO58_06665 [Anaerolineales bacterium]|nr:hypothetical protein [Anaerolineales bacterium]
MAATAVLDKLAPMDIGIDVTLSAEPGDTHPLTIDVTRFAINLLMAADQLETGKLMFE